MQRARRGLAGEGAKRHQGALLVGHAGPVGGIIELPVADGDEAGRAGIVREPVVAGEQRGDGYYIGGSQRLRLPDAEIGGGERQQSGVGVEDAGLHRPVEQAPLAQVLEPVGAGQGRALEGSAVFEGHAVIGQQTSAYRRTVEELEQRIGVLLAGRRDGCALAAPSAQRGAGSSGAQTLGRAGSGPVQKNEEEEQLFHRKGKGGW